MEEIEVKILEVDKVSIEQCLLEIGAQKTFEGELSATLYDFRDRSIYNKQDVFRVRTEGEKVVVTYKEFVESDGAKIRKEHEFVASDKEQVEKIIALLGLEPKKSTRKTRVSYNLGNAHIEFDKYHDDLEHIPLFLEIEAPDTATIYDIAQKLGFSEEQCLPWSLNDVEAHYAR